jgi:hypothetical protein
MNELNLYRHTDRPGDRGYKTLFLAPEYPGYAAFHPIPGNALGYNDQKGHRGARAFLGLRTVSSCRSDSRMKIQIRAAVAPVIKPLAGATRFDIDAGLL